MGQRPEPSPYVPPPGPVPPRIRGNRRVVLGVVLLVLVVVMGGVGAGLGRISATYKNRGQGSGSVGPDTPTATGTLGPKSATPTTPGRPNTPDQALALTDQQALDELNLESTESSTRISGLVGSWVPQVSSKCVGIRVDIEPNYFPDGVADIEHVTIQQLLAFHLSMHNRFGALTVRPTQLGVVSDQATTGPCAQQAVWSSVVPQQFGSAEDANTWCAANMPPIQECGARYVARPGERSRLVTRQ